MIALTTASKIITGTVGLIKSVDRRVILSPIIKWPLTSTRINIIKIESAQQH